MEKKKKNSQNELKKNFSLQNFNGQDGKSESSKEEHSISLEEKIKEQQELEYKQAKLIKMTEEPIDVDPTEESDSTTNENRKSSISISDEVVKNNSIKKIDSLQEFDDHIIYNGVKINKPFVEKPCNGDDHDIRIYYPPNLGGGHKRLFRKTMNLCSLYVQGKNEIRRDKSYVYEEYLQSDGFDIKVYTVGEDYAHAEARKSPTIDGVVKVSE